MVELGFVVVYVLSKKAIVVLQTPEAFLLYVPCSQFNTEFCLKKRCTKSYVGQVPSSFINFTIKSNFQVLCDFNGDWYFRVVKTQ